jgi:hypothetical protein
MKTLQANPNQIITLNDFPVYDEKDLRDYFETYKKSSGANIPLCPVIPREIVSPFFNTSLSNKYQEFIKSHPESEYFLLDGTHRTTAATLTKSPIGIIIFKEDKDILEAKKLTISRKILPSKVLDTNIKGNCKILKDHFTKKPHFQTVKEKTERMIRERVIDQYLIEYHNT